MAGDDARPRFVVVVVVGGSEEGMPGANDGDCCRCDGGGDGVRSELTLKSDDVCRVEIVGDGSVVFDGELVTRTSAGSKRILLFSLRGFEIGLFFYVFIFVCFYLFKVKYNRSIALS